MKSAFDSRRLAALLLLSLCLHAAAIAWLSRHPSPPAAWPAPLTLRLAAAAPPAAPNQHIPPDPTQPARASTGALPWAALPAAHPPLAAPRHGRRPAAMRAAAQGAKAATAAPAAAPARAPADAAPVLSLQMPERYRVRIPPAALLSYTLSYTDTHGSPRRGTAPGAAAYIDWQYGDTGYRLRIDGVLGALTSEGGSSDAGIAPDGVPSATGAQDRASVLMQLAGIGLADAGQVKDVIEIVVAGAGDARIARFQVLGEEDLDTGLGRYSAWRLVMLAPAGKPRLEVWLAPDLGWYPAQLRVTAPDGRSATQLLAHIDPAPPR